VEGKPQQYESDQGLNRRHGNPPSARCAGGGYGLLRKQTCGAKQTMIVGRDTFAAEVVPARRTPRRGLAPGVMKTALPRQWRRNRPAVGGVRHGTPVNSWNDTFQCAPPRHGGSSKCGW